MPLSPGQARQLRFLVLEDHGFQRWAIAKALESLGVSHVTLAADGAEGLATLAAASPPIDVVVTDLNMPGMDGMEFIRKVAALDQPVALIVSSEQPAALISLVSSMARAYGVMLLDALQKPLTARKLAAALERLPAALDEASRPRDGARFATADILAAASRGEFEAFFQPQFEVASGEVRGAEALARWHHPLHGLVLPDAFVGPLEREGAMDALNIAVVEQAAAACRCWRDAGADVRVAINLSYASLADVTVADRLAQVLERHGLEKRLMTIELTETTAIESLAQVLENLSRLRMLGFGLAIDDYGIGYSSLQQLTSIPFTELKIDRSFVQAASRTAASRAILESSIDMASQLGLSVVAEGVESPEQLELLRELGCPLAQGYLVAPPMPAGAFQEALLTGRWPTLPAR